MSEFDQNCYLLLFLNKGYKGQKGGNQNAIDS